MWEKHIKSAGGQPPSSPKFPDLLRDGVIHQDLAIYTRGLLLKVRSLIDVSVRVLVEAYSQLKDANPDPTALTQLEKNSEPYEFPVFPEYLMRQLRRFEN